MAMGTPEFRAACAEKLLTEQHVAVVPGSAFGANGEGYLRITCVKSMKELDEGLRRMRAAFTARAI